jgi:hypothetical protein
MRLFLLIITAVLLGWSCAPAGLGKVTGNPFRIDPGLPLEPETWEGAEMVEFMLLGFKDGLTADEWTTTLNRADEVQAITQSIAELRPIRRQLSVEPDAYRGRTDCPKGGRSFGRSDFPALLQCTERQIQQKSFQMVGLLLDLDESALTYLLRASSDSEKCRVESGVLTCDRSRPPGLFSGGRPVFSQAFRIIRPILNGREREEAVETVLGLEGDETFGSFEFRLELRREESPAPDEVLLKGTAFLKPGSDLRKDGKPVDSFLTGYAEIRLRLPSLN